MIVTPVARRSEDRFGPAYVSQLLESQQPSSTAKPSPHHTNAPSSSKSGGIHLSRNLTLLIILASVFVFLTILSFILYYLWRRHRRLVTERRVSRAFEPIRDSKSTFSTRTTRASGHSRDGSADSNDSDSGMTIGADLSTLDRSISMNSSSWEYGRSSTSSRPASLNDAPPRILEPSNENGEQNQLLAPWPSRAHSTRAAPDSIPFPPMAETRKAWIDHGKVKWGAGQGDGRDGFAYARVDPDPMTRARSVSPSIGGLSMSSMDSDASRVTLMPPEGR